MSDFYNFRFKIRLLTFLICICLIGILITDLLLFPRQATIENKVETNHKILVEHDSLFAQNTKAHKGNSDTLKILVTDMDTLFKIMGKWR